MVCLLRDVPKGLRSRAVLTVEPRSGAPIRREGKEYELHAGVRDVKTQTRGSKTLYEVTLCTPLLLPKFPVRYWVRGAKLPVEWNPPQSKASGRRHPNRARPSRQ